MGGLTIRRVRGGSSTSVFRTREFISSRLGPSNMECKFGLAALLTRKLVKLFTPCYCFFYFHTPSQESLPIRER